MAETSPNIHLHCSVCPKKPTFSDVSHLLTHLSSKGHLAHHHKLGVRAMTDIPARYQLQQYDQWHLENNIDTLISERMITKEQKRPRGRGSQATMPKHQKKQKQASRSLSAALDPDLTSRITDNPFTARVDQQYHTISSNPFSNASPRPRPSKPRLFLWSTRHPTQFNPIPVEPFSSPTHRLFVAPTSTAPMAPMFRKTYTHDREDEDDDISEVTRLKGVFWPGMDIFDAATPDTKRKRNQKKHTSVAESLERHSLFVEATEISFTPAGSLYKARTITGLPDIDSSPYKLDIPTPKQKRRQSRSVLADKDVNTSAKPVGINQAGPIRAFGPILNSNSTTASSNAPRQLNMAPANKRKRDFQVLDQRDTQPFGMQTGMPVLTSTFQPSPTFDPSRPPRTGSAVFDPRHAPTYHNTFFTEAFEHYQPTMFNFPVYGYGYYAPAVYDLPAYMPLPSQQHSDSKTVTTDLESAVDCKVTPADANDDDLTISTRSDE